MLSKIITAGSKNNTKIPVDSMLENPFVLNNSVDYRPFYGIRIISKVDEDNILDSGDFSIYPNPATNYIEVVLDNSFDNGSLILTNSKGTVITTQNLTRNFARFNISGLACGLYFIKFFNNGIMRSKTFIINK